MTLTVLLAAAITGQITRPTIDDEQLNAKWQAAREIHLPRVVLHRNGAVIDGRREIGPIGVRNTLGSMDFPWRNPAGRIDGDNDTIKAIWPPDLAARPQQVILQEVNKQRASWQWPVGAHFFELHIHKRGHPFELRVLHKHKEGYGIDCYEPRIFAPEIPRELFKGEVRLAVSRRSGHPRNERRFQGVVSYIDDAPGINWLNVVYAKTWEDLTGSDLHHAGKGDGWVTPRNYGGWMTGSRTIDDCRQCHQDTGQHVDKFDPRREWYTFLHGGDGVFSVDPIDRRHVSRPSARLDRWVWRNN